MKWIYPSILAVVIFLVCAFFAMSFMLRDSIGPHNPVSWSKQNTIFFSGVLHVESTDKFVIKTVNGEIVAKSRPVEIEGRDGPVYVATYVATASEYYRTSKSVTIYSDTDSELFYFWDPTNCGLFLP